MMRTRAWRRKQSERVVKRRLKNYKSKMPFAAELQNSKKLCGGFRKNHWGCGCRLCKPWKY